MNSMHPSEILSNLVCNKNFVLNVKLLDVYYQNIILLSDVIMIMKYEILYFLQYPEEIELIGHKEESSNIGM